MFSVQSHWDTEQIHFSPFNSTSAAHFIEHFPIAISDITGLFNICWQMRKDEYLMLKHEAKLSIDFLDANLKESFEHVFMQKVEFPMKFDAILQ